MDEKVYYIIMNCENLPSRYSKERSGIFKNQFMLYLDEDNFSIFEDRKQANKIVKECERLADEAGMPDIWFGHYVCRCKVFPSS